MDVPHVIANRFRIESELGRGGMGTVYRALHLGLERPVAIKILKSEFALDPEVATRFMREARTMARLRHHGAAIIFDAGKLADHRPFIVMEYVEGRTLAEHLKEHKRLSSERAVQIGIEICEVLAEAHRVGIVHRDLKPSNIMLNERGVCVLDFGIAKVLATAAALEDVTRTQHTTESGIIIGTPRYMSPEQCMGHKVEHTSDLYSLGVVLYEMLAGRPPFIDLLPSAVLVKQATAPPPPLLSLHRDKNIPPALAAVVHLLLTKNPAERPASAAATGKLLARSLSLTSSVNTAYVAPMIGPLSFINAAPPTTPLASTLELLNIKRSAFFPVGFTLAVVALLGALLQLRTPHESPTSRLSQDEARSIARTLPATFTSRSATSRPVHRVADSLTPADAERIAQKLLHNSASHARGVRLPSGTTGIAALHKLPQAGSTYLCLIEQRGRANSNHPASSSYQVTRRTPLGATDTRTGAWSAETIDINGDGLDEVLCTRTNRTGANESRLMLYVPGTNQIYGLRVEPDGNELNNLRFVWSQSAATPTAAVYRPALRQRARLLIAAL